jgi:hypothetical protein
MTGYREAGPVEVGVGGHGSLDAALVVVGSRTRSAVMAGLRDSISRTVLLQAHSAVAVVRPVGAEPYRAAVGRRSRSAVPMGAPDTAVT